MPKFIMEGRDHAARAESDFVLGFIEAMFFTERAAPLYTKGNWFSRKTQKAVAEGEAGGSLPYDAGYSDIHPDSLAAIRADCEAWQAQHAALLSLAFEPGTGYDETQAGGDYWFTRNGHGVGFWSREQLQIDVGKMPDGTLFSGVEAEEAGAKCIGVIGDLLSAACRHDEVNPFFGDHVTHGNAPFVHVDL